MYAEEAGGYAGVALNYIRAELSGQEREMILCVPNQGAIPGLLDMDVVEITCTIKDGNILLPRSWWKNMWSQIMNTQKDGAKWDLQEA